MGKKGTPHRKWSKEEKLRFIRLHLDEHISITEIEKKYGVRNSMVSAWVKRYLEDGEEGLEPKNGNPYTQNSSYSFQSGPTMEIHPAKPVSRC